MSDYISRQAAIDVFGKLSQGKYYTKLINSIPSADVVEVVRCKDCKWHTKDWHEDKRRKVGGYWVIGCDNHNIAERVYGLGEDNQFCSYGERAEA